MVISVGQYMVQQQRSLRASIANRLAREGLGRMERAAHVALTEMFPPYAWPGGYQIMYIDEEGGYVCPACAKKEYIEEGRTFTRDIYYEGPNVFCDGCNREIESAYGDPWADEDEEDAR